MNSFNHVFVIIPALNEALSIQTIIKTLLDLLPCVCVVVIDDGSSDETAKIAKKAGATVIQTGLNTGTGNAVRVGLLYVKQHGAKTIILLDADGQHDPKYIPSLLRELHHGNDIVIGSRYVNKTENCTSIVRNFGTKVISMAISIRYGVVVYDSTSGFRVMNQRAMRVLVEDYPTKFPEPETIVKLIKEGYRIKEVSVPMNKRLYGKSSISLWKAMKLMTFILKKIVFNP